MIKTLLLVAGFAGMVCGRPGGQVWRYEYTASIEPWCEASRAELQRIRTPTNGLGVQYLCRPCGGQDQRAPGHILMMMSA